MLLNHLERLVAAQSVVDIKHIYNEAVRDYRYKHAVCYASYLANFPSAVIRENSQIHSNFSEAFNEEIAQEFRGDTLPWIEWAKNNSGSIRLSKLSAEMKHRPDFTQAFAVAQRHGLAAARLISLRGLVAGAHGVVAICPAPGIGTDAEKLIWAKVRREVSALTGVTHMRLATIGRTVQGSGLTPRQREVLEWTSAGKTVAEVATILGLTPATVEKHLRLARDSLDAGSTAHAVLKAHITNQIFPPVWV